MRIRESTIPLAVDDARGLRRVQGWDFIIFPYNSIISGKIVYEAI